MNRELHEEQPPRRWPWWLLGIVGVPVLCAVALHLTPQPEAEVRLAHLRELGYPTSLKELAATRPRLPDAENLCIPLATIASELQQPQGTSVPYAGKASDYERGKPWTDEDIQATRRFLAANSNALARMPEVTRLPRGDNQLDYGKGFKMLLPQLAQFKSVAQALAAQAGLAAEEGRPHDALTSHLGMVAIARGLDDEPILISQLVRIAIETIACGSVERVLNRTEIAEADLATLQAAMETRTPLRMGMNLHGELCNGLDLFDGGPSAIANMGASPGANASEAKMEEAFLTLYRASGLMNSDRAAYIRLMADLIDIARLNPWERKGPLAKWEADLMEIRSTWYKRRIITGMLLPALSNCTSREANGLAKLQCTIVGLAVERYRRAHGGDTPPRLADLVPAFLPSIPPDPFDGKPLRYEQRDKGYVAYSVGPDLDDDHGRERRKNQGNDDYDVTFIVER